MCDAALTGPVIALVETTGDQVRELRRYCSKSVDLSGSTPRSNNFAASILARTQISFLSRRVKQPEQTRC